MTHNEKRTVWWKEGLAALMTGALYGVTNSVVGHPLDTIKTKMQVTKEYHGKSMLNSIKLLYKTEGVVGFFRGVFPPMIGGSLFRSVQFAAFEAIYTKLEKDPFWSTQIPYTSGLELRVLLGTFASGTSRAIIECPFEYSKVQRQTGQVWKFSKMYQGFKVVWMRSVGILSTYFIIVDFFRRNTNAYKHQYGIFFMNGFCACIGFLTIWPLEILKNQVQSMKSVEGKLSLWKLLKQRVHEHGLFNAFFRGSLPGLLSVFIRNGVAMMVMINAQKLLTHYGYRN